MVQKPGFILRIHKPRETQGWAFGISDSSPILLPSKSLERPHLHFIDGTKQWATGPPRIEDTVTGKEVFQLAGRYAEPTDAQWDGWYLVAGYSSGEVLFWASIIYSLDRDMYLELA